jgi:hypothetical protein
MIWGAADAFVYYDNHDLETELHTEHHDIASVLKLNNL